MFAFFSEARNLERITPGWLRFRILPPLPQDMSEGTVIHYRLRLYGVPLRWRSRITAWDPPHRFVDEQERGPYRVWVHEHTFEPAGAGTLCRDRVDYAVPGGRFVDRFLVRPSLERIFAYRSAALAAHFAGDGERANPGA